MEHTDTDSTVQHLTMTTSTEALKEVNGDKLKENQGQAKSYYFETQTKRMKSYYLKHQQALIGRKVLFNNSSGTVKYVGPLLHTNKPTTANDELWIGIQWDQFNRGKHNGTVNGYKYFLCPQNQGSMIKYEKIEFGYRLEIALFKRYFKTEQLHHAKDIYDNLTIIKKELKEEPENQQNIKIQEVLSKKIHKIEYDAQAYLDTVKKSKKIMIEFVGFDEIWTKINNLGKIQSISLSECRICDLGPLGNLNSLLKSLKILSLEDNLLSDWNQVYQLGYQLPQLTELSISHNTFHAPQESFENLKQIVLSGRTESLNLDNLQLFKNLRCLILINTNLTWKTFFKVVPAFKKVKEFILCKNDLSDIDSMDCQKLKYLQETRFLNLEATNLTNFSDLKVFSKLPYLEKLCLNKNPLKEFGRNIQGFIELKHLSVQSCSFTNSVILYEISQFKNLQALNVKHNPIGQKFGNSYVRMRAVAQIFKLNQINGAQLKKSERKDCEIFYLRQTFRQYFAFKKVPDYDYDFEDFLKYCQEHHPNMIIFIKKYGNPYEVQKKQQIQALIKEEVKATENKKGTGMVQVTIEYKQNGSTDKKKVPLSWTLSSLKNFFSKISKIPVGMLKLISLADQTSNEEEMIEDHKTLSFYNLKSGSKIIVERRP